MSKVAPLAGSVDRNDEEAQKIAVTKVAPLAGSVDRNMGGLENLLGMARRSPRGERG